MEPADRERVAWHEQSLAIRSKDAMYITEIDFTQPFLEQTAKSYILVPTANIETQEMRYILTPEVERPLVRGEMKEVECYLFNHRYAIGSFFKMRLRFAPVNVRGNTSSQQLGGYHFVAPWQEVIDSGAIRVGSHVEVYGYTDEGRVVFVFRRMDLNDYMQEQITVSGKKIGNRAVFTVGWLDSYSMLIKEPAEIVEMTFSG